MHGKGNRIAYSEQLVRFKEDPSRADVLCHAGAILQLDGKEEVKPFFSPPFGDLWCERFHLGRYDAKGFPVGPLSKG